MIIELIKKLKKDPYNVTNAFNQKEIEEIILVSADKYYNTGESIIEDAVYDMLIDFLKSKFPKSKVLKTVGSTIKAKNKVKLDYHLGSMDKIKPPSKVLDKWKEKFAGPYYLTEKLDGISGLIVYRKNGNVNLYTRGTATEGLNITPLLKYLENIPKHSEIVKYMENHDLKGTKNIVAFRGELIIPKKVFNKKWKTKFKNPRNTVAGLVNSKHINPKLAKDTKFVIYEIVEPFLKISKQLDIIKQTDFIKVHHKIVENLDYPFLSKYLLTRRKQSLYQIDGIIITNNDNHKRNITGNPKYAFAFKDVLDDQKAVSTVINIDWKYLRTDI